jgi:glycerophosphoryl diester phosphodiesterase
VEYQQSFRTFAIFDAFNPVIMNQYNPHVCMLKMAAFLLLLVAAGCATTRKTSRENMEPISFYKVGHRGARGLMPENTIPAFEKGIEAGANTIEFDVHITKDHKVVVYHDASFTPSYTTLPDGSDIPAAERKKYTFYQMDYKDIRKFIIGEKAYAAFPDQQRLKTYAPLLSEMIDSVEIFTKANHYPPVAYLLEIKSGAHTDGFEQPGPEEYMHLMMGVLKPYLKQLRGRLIIQSFDMRPLKVLHRDYPHIPLGFLTGDPKVSVGQQLKALGFIPAFYNPAFHLVSPAFLKECHGKGIKVLPWTVEKVADAARLKNMGVDGIITDYPDRIKTF